MRQCQRVVNKTEPIADRREVFTESREKGANKDTL